MWRSGTKCYSRKDTSRPFLPCPPETESSVLPSAELFDRSVMHEHVGEFIYEVDTTSSGDQLTRIDASKTDLLSACVSVCDSDTSRHSEHLGTTVEMRARHSIKTTDNLCNDRGADDTRETSAHSFCIDMRVADHLESISGEPHLEFEDNRSGDSCSRGTLYPTSLALIGYAKFNDDMLAWSQHQNQEETATLLPSGERFCEEPSRLLSAVRWLIRCFCMITYFPRLYSN